MTHYFEMFKKVLLEHSTSDSFNEAIKEWTITDLYSDRGMENCICGHDIVQNVVIEHDESGEELIIGNICMKKFLANDPMHKKVIAALRKSSKEQSLALEVDELFNGGKLSLKLKYKERTKYDKHIFVFTRTSKKYAEKLKEKLSEEALDSPSGEKKHSNAVKMDKSKVLHFATRERPSSDLQTGDVFTGTISLTNIWDYKGYFGRSIRLEDVKLISPKDDSSGSSDSF